MYLQDGRLRTLFQSASPIIHLNGSKPNLATEKLGGEAVISDSGGTADLWRQDIEVHKSHHRSHSRALRNLSCVAEPKKKARAKPCRDRHYPRAKFHSISLRWKDNRIFKAYARNKLATPASATKFYSCSIPPVFSGLSGSIAMPF